MELIKKNIHMDRIKCRAATQITLEDDRNVPDQKPDMERLILQRGSVVVDEIKPTEDHVPRMAARTAWRDSFPLRNRFTWTASGMGMLWKPNRCWRI